MATEADAIPYEPSLLRGERLLVLAPHPDDEVIACGGLIAQHVLEIRQVRVVVATDGGEAGDAAQRERESRRGLQLLGASEGEFLRFPDRHLDEHRLACGERIAAIIREWRPDLILVPSPVEIHPDHSALAVAFCELVQRDAALFAEAAAARVAFYEVGQPLRPNTIVDITAVAARKYEAIAAHASQLELRDYVSYARGLNAYRAMTMPPEVRYAEAYYVVTLPELRTTSVSSLQALIGNARLLTEEMREPLPVSVVVRTKNRPALLAEALASIRATGYPCEIVVVNDGGEQVDPGAGVRLIEHPQSLGRAEAGNSGARAASKTFLAFLDDDDLLYPEHFDVLTRAAAGDAHRAWYSDAVSAFVRRGPSGALETEQRMRLYASDFDRQLLLADNYIPLPTLLFRRDDFLELGGFDPQFDLFEDWDFLIRLAGRGDFVRVPRVTCEIRHVAGSGSVVMAATSDGVAVEAKLRVWAKHPQLITPLVFANAMEARKREVMDAVHTSVEQRGLSGGLTREIDRLAREKEYLAHTLRERESSIDTLDALAREWKDLYAEAEQRREQATIELTSLQQDLTDLQHLYDEKKTAETALYAEIFRLQGLLETIYGSRTWKVHSIVQKMKGGG